MYLLLVIIHVLNCLVMVGAVLLQSGKGADMGVTFGGSSQTIFGGRGAATFLSKVTVGAAILFFTTSLSLSVLTRTRASTASVIDPPKTSAPSATPTTSTPTVEGTPAAAPSTDSTPSVPQTVPSSVTTPAPATPTP